METKLSELADEYEFEEPEIARALRAGSEKAGFYVGKALISDYPLLGTVLHPAARLAFFETEHWDPAVAKRARHLLIALVESIPSPLIVISPQARRLLPRRSQRGESCNGDAGEFRAKGEEFICGQRPG
ncbi:hypothetical protein B0H13DRAFT_465885 [Mycena leptocephala]|nr:hypothetical protein B0H13DRAFT_465885 [Mycena leptocephala]